jgi:response regulator of citrate/malate metabolism
MLGMAKMDNIERLGVKDYILKPVMFDHFMKIMKKIDKN